MKDTINTHLGLDDLLENDMSSYELFHSLPRELRQRAIERDVRSFDELCACVSGRDSS